MNYEAEMEKWNLNESAESGRTAVELCETTVLLS